MPTRGEKKRRKKRKEEQGEQNDHERGGPTKPVQRAEFGRYISTAIRFRHVARLCRLLL